MASRPLRLDCHRRRSGRRRSCRYTTAEHTLCAEGVPSGHQQGRLPQLAWSVVRVRVWLGLPRLVGVRAGLGLPLSLLLVQVRVSRLLLSFRVGWVGLSFQVRGRVWLLLPLSLLVRWSGESVLLPLFLAVRSLVRSLACRRRRSSHRRWCRCTRAGYTPSAEGLPSRP